MVTVYFENTNRLGISTYAEKVAHFDDEETYDACLKSLTKHAEKNNFCIVTESINETSINDIPESIENHYFLFGSDACRKLSDEGEDALLEYVKKNGDWSIYKYNTGTSSPLDLLSSFNGWCDYDTITEELYNKLLEI